MRSKEILDRTLKLKPAERFLIIEGLIESIDQPDKKLDGIWIEEAEKRLKAYREGRLEGIPIEDVFNEKPGSEEINKTDIGIPQSMVNRAQ